MKQIARKLDRGVRRVKLLLPYDQGGFLDTLYREAKVEQVEYAEKIAVTAVCTPATIGKARAFLAEDGSAVIT